MQIFSNIIINDKLSIIDQSAGQKINEKDYHPSDRQII